MRVIFLIIFLCVNIFADISNILLKIKEIQNSKKIFLPLPDYNVFVGKQKKYKEVFLKTDKTSNNIELKLYAIFNQKVNINKKWKKIGDFISGYKIIKIFPDKVFLKKEGKFIVLKMTSSLIKVSK